MESRRQSRHKARQCCFNEATLFQAWKAFVKRSTAPNKIGGFNEATLFQAWKGWVRSCLSCSLVSFNEATLFQAWKVVSFGYIAHPSPRFNEATLFQAWKVGDRPVFEVDRFASMRPRFFKRGKIPSIAATCFVVMLQ